MDNNPYVPPASVTATEAKPSGQLAKQRTIVGLSWGGLAVSLTFGWELLTDLGLLTRVPLALLFFWMALVAIPFALGIWCWMKRFPGSRWPTYFAYTIGFTPFALSFVAVFFLGLT